MEQTPTKEEDESPAKKAKIDAAEEEKVEDGVEKVDDKDSKDKADGQSMEVDQENDTKPMEMDGQV